MANTNPLIHDGVLAIKIQKSLMAEYKEVVLEEGRTVSGSIRKHMRDYVNNSKQNNKEMS